MTDIEARKGDEVPKVKRMFSWSDSSPAIAEWVYLIIKNDDDDLETEETKKKKKLELWRKSAEDSLHVWESISGVDSAWMRMISHKTTKKKVVVWYLMGLTSVVELLLKIDSIWPKIVDINNALTS